MNLGQGFASQVRKEHVLAAIDYIADHGAKGERGIWYVQRESISWVVECDCEVYALNDVMRTAYCYAEGKEPAGADKKFTAEQLGELKYTTRTPFNSHKARDRLKKLGFEVIQMIDVVFLNIRNRYRPGMTGAELYEATRGDWKIGGNRDNVTYAVAVAGGQVRGVYRIHFWESVGNRWRFIGERDAGLWNLCVGREKVMPQSPVMYGELNDIIDTEQVDFGGSNIMEIRNMSLLRQFYQIIFYGPPGTGKTYSAMEMLGELFGADEWESLQGDRWDIVQFHPSYNYEDFVRGVQVKTGDDKKVAYETVNRIFGEMCERAAESGEPHALIIDEINRANVSAVLGELIYALEYRGNEVQTPYLVNGKRGIIVPENLYIIGTMNTADRTIGQIDYAVRRRFAFVHIAPDKTVITNADAKKFFADVDKLFAKDGEYMSPDFDAEDVRIGHSYFLADGAELGNKIIYQVVPILREYVRDGVLLPESEKVIKGIKERAHQLAKKPPSDESESDSPADDEEETKGGRRYFYWRNGDRYGVDGVGRAAFGVIKNFIEQHTKMDAVALQQEFASLDLGQHKRVVLLENAPPPGSTKRYFYDDPVSLPNGETVLISTEWGATGTSEPQWNEFKEKMVTHGYSIGQCHLVNIGENDGNDPRARSWDDCHKHGFVSGRGVGYKASIEKIKKGDFVFVRIAEAQEGKNGFIACAEVLEEAVHIAEFRTAEGGLLADYDVGGGQTYREKYPNAFAEDYPDYAVRVKWLPGVKSRNDTVQISSAVRKLRVGKINQNDFAKLRNAFDLPGFDK